MHAIILAGGRGQRLLPFTAHQPKALMDIGGYPLLEILLRQLRVAGFRRVTLCVSHMQAAIRDYLSEASQCGLSIDYCVDTRPRGTAGPLLPIEDWEAPALILNGDILTTIDFADLCRRHYHSRSPMTIVYSRLTLPIEMGTLQLVGDRVHGFIEKPHIKVDVSVGVYVADPSVRRFIEPDQVVDMPDLIAKLIQSDQVVNAYFFPDRWHDIGTPERYKRAVADFVAQPGAYLPAVYLDGPIPRMVNS